MSLPTDTVNDNLRTSLQALTAVLARPFTPIPVPADAPQMERAVIEMANAHRATQMILEAHTATFSAMAHALQNLQLRVSSVEDESTSGIPIVPPEPFDGKPQNFADFITAVSLAFLCDPHTYADDAAKVYFTLSYMSLGLASMWRCRMVKNINEGIYTITTWDSFRNLLAGTFGTDADRKSEARRSARVRSIHRD